MQEQQFIEENGYMLADLAKGVEIVASIHYTPKKNPVWLLVGVESRKPLEKGGFDQVWRAYQTV